MACLSSKGRGGKGIKSEGGRGGGESMGFSGSFEEAMEREEGRDMALYREGGTEREKVKRGGGMAGEGRDDGGRR